MKSGSFSLGVTKCRRFSAA